MLFRHRLVEAQRSLIDRLRPNGADDAARPGAIHVIGNCQGQSVAHAMRMLLPDRAVGFTSAFGIESRYPTMSALVDALAPCEAVFANPFAAPFRDGGDYEVLRAGTRLVPIPTIVFAAFHPDAIYVGHETGGAGMVFGPMGGHHSALVLHGFLEGFGIERTLALFRRDVFRRVGYLDTWDEAVATLCRLGRDAHYPLEETIARWTRRGCFMHGINHPKMFCAADLARGLLARAGIDYVDCDLDGYLPDDFIRMGTWPVYPAIGEHYGVPSSDLFYKASSRRSGAARTMTVREFVTASFESYAGRERERLVSARVEAWRADSALRADLAAA